MLLFQLSSYILISTIKQFMLNQFNTYNDNIVVLFAYNLPQVTKYGDYLPPI
ncbi:hypothetical protein F383_35928 [Gossypium arboreum]|uniref:Uncharacterized protein n=1 Tax=Gossypium arboreum TaxID=29729 RepID=A0A0B0N7B4_GOSAR|nr:hypothetical protein F383_35928 [Gossypium arboreum]